MWRGVFLTVGLKIRLAVIVNPYGYGSIGYGGYGPWCWGDWGPGLKSVDGILRGLVFNCGGGELWVLVDIGSVKWARCWILVEMMVLVNE